MTEKQYGRIIEDTKAANDWDWELAYLEYIRPMPYCQWLPRLHAWSSVAADPHYWAVAA